MYPHLHVHSHFSLGAGASSPESLIEAALQRHCTTLACTDTNGVYGAVEFQQAAELAGVRPILGAHLISGGQEAVVLAEDERGWAALCRAITGIRWNERNPKAWPFALSAQLATDRAGLAVLSRDVELLERLAQLSGTDGLYAELVPGRQRHQVLATARRLKIPPVVTNAVWFAHPEEWARHRLLVAIARNSTLSALPAESVAPRDAWLKPRAELARHFPDCPEAMDNAATLADRCRYRIPIGRIVPPRLAAAEDAFAQLRAAAYEGAARKYGTVAPMVRDRLEHELAIIAAKQFADYFLVVRDIVLHGPTHCGRGSVANSVVSYCLGITHVEPLGAGLLFERFLNPERKDPPDIDLDFPWDERDHVLAYVFRQYPLPRAAMVANHNTFKLRGALREVAKVHGRPAGEIREVTRRIPWYSDNVPIGELLATHPNYAGLNLPAYWQELATTATPLVGTPRHLSLHPGGVVIVPGALTDYVPIEPAVKELDGAPDLTVPVIQFEKDGAEDAGLVKIDLLGNRSLAVIRDGIAAVAANTGRQLDYTSQDAGEDAATRELFRTGRTMGVFYTESPASRALCIKSQAESYELLVLNTSIIRPASNKWIKVYLERLHGGAYEPLDPCLRDVLSETFGVMVYQEDVVNVSAAFAGMPLSTGDGLRKALSKKRPTKALASYADEFTAGALAMGRDPVVIEQVWHMIMSFAGYSFCKGHSCSYIQVAQQSAFLKAHYPAEFFAGVLANGGGFYHPFAYVAEARRAGLTILPPDVNASEFRTTGCSSEVQVGLQFVKGLTLAGVEAVLNGGRPYRSLHDLRERSRIGQEDLRLLIKVGALDGIANGMTRPMMLWAVDAEKGNRRGRACPARLEPAGPCPLAAEAAARPGGSLKRPERLATLGPAAPLSLLKPETRNLAPHLPEYPAERRREDAYALLGFTTDAHPMDLYRDRLRRFRLTPSTELHRHVGQTVLCAGMLTTAKPVHTARDEPMQFATFDDGHGLIEAVMFPDIHRKRSHVLFDQGPFLFRGIVEQEWGAISVTMTGLERVERLGGRG